MLYDYVELPDNTKIAHSEVLPDGTIKIGIERPREGGFDFAYCHIPFRKWESTSGFSMSELDSLQKYLLNNAPLIWELAEEVSARGGRVA